MTKDEMRFLLEECTVTEPRMTASSRAMTCTVDPNAKDVPDEQAMLISKQYRYLFMPPGIKRDSELAVQLLNRLYRNRP